MWLLPRSQVKDQVPGHYPNLEKASAKTRKVQRGAILQPSELVKQHYHWDNLFYLYRDPKHVIAKLFELMICMITLVSGGMKRPGRTPFAGPQRTISVKDVICALEREPQMTKSRLVYRLHERLPGDSTAD